MAEEELRRSTGFWIPLGTGVSAEGELTPVPAGV